MNVDRLLNNIIEQIKEAQLKLGFVREVIRLYYPVLSLSLLLQTKCENAKELLALLEQENKLSSSALGEIKFLLCRDNRIEVSIPSQGAVYVHEKIADPVFLKSLVNLFQENHHLTIEALCACFAQYNPNYVCQKMDPGTDFDYVLYFPDENPDAWYYCVRMEMGHTIYHRFTKEDYEQLAIL